MTHFTTRGTNSYLVIKLPVASIEEIVPAVCCRAIRLPHCNIDDQLFFTFPRLRQTYRCSFFLACALYAWKLLSDTLRVYI